MSPRKLELLAPAGNAAVAIEAIKHGADAVYIGAATHGARQAASNSIEEIRRVTEFAHIYDARVYVTVNTIVFDHELAGVERMIRELYEAGADALIVQDMGILRMDIPPIALHASTQCDIRTPEKARFLQEVGFSQLVLARELTISEIREIERAVTIPIEVFVHGALCVSYSGRCSAGYACAGRSGNRGECTQVCRLPYSLKDATGKVITRDKYLLSLKDFRADMHLEELIDAGVSSFKIEGRLKETGYVKNVTAYYNSRLDEIVVSSGGTLKRSSCGKVELKFQPDLSKSFNRGFTNYFLSGKSDPNGIANIETPKSMGETVKDINDLRPGDGISFFDKDGSYTGIQVNGIRNGQIIGNRPIRLPGGTKIYRTSSIEWKKMMDRETAGRKVALSIELDETGITARDETGAMVRLSFPINGETAKKTTDYRQVFEKLGNTPFYLSGFKSSLDEKFFPLSVMSSLRRETIEKILEAKKDTYKFDYRKPENEQYPYPGSSLESRDNVANRQAYDFYKSHGVKKINMAVELSPRQKLHGKEIMTTRHCVLRTLGMCLKNHPELKLPLRMENGSLSFLPIFDCKNCEMKIFS